MLAASLRGQERQQHLLEGVYFSKLHCLGDKILSGVYSVFLSRLQCSFSEEQNSDLRPFRQALLSGPARPSRSRGRHAGRVFFYVLELQLDRQLKKVILAYSGWNNN